MVQFTRKVAIDICKRLALLFFEGTGTPIADGAVDEIFEDIEEGVIDTIPLDDFVTNEWINSTLLLIRTIYGILINAISEEDQLL